MTFRSDFQGAFRVAWLVVRSHGGRWAVLVQAVLPAPLLLTSAIWSHGISGQMGGFRDPLALIPVINFLAALSGALLSVMAMEPLGPLKHLRVRSGPVTRLLLVGAVITCVAISLAAFRWAFVPFAIQESALRQDAILYGRNALGFAGLGLLGTVVVGGRLGWVLPAALGWAAFFANRDNAISAWLLLRWPLVDLNSAPAFGVAVAFGIVGAVTFIIRGEGVRPRLRLIILNPRHYRPLIMFARSRSIRVQASLVGGVCVLSVVANSVIINPNGLATLITEVIVPVTAAVVLCFGLSSRIVALELTLPRFLAQLELITASLVILFSATLLWASALLDGSLSSASLLTKYCGYARLGLLAAHWTRRRCWLVPLAWGSAALLPALQSEWTRVDVPVGWWWWPIQSTSTDTATLQVGLLIAAIALCATRLYVSPRRVLSPSWLRLSRQARDTQRGTVSGRLMD